MAVASAVPVFAVAGCGISAEHSARTIPRPDLMSHTPHAAVETTGPVDERIFLIKDGRLAAVTRQIHDSPTVTSVSADLLAGPTSAERDAGYSSALAGTDLVATVGRQGSEAVVELAADGADQVRNDQVLGFAQIVCTLTGLSNVTSVSFRHGGRTVAVPRADGSLSESPLSSADYQSLTAPGA